MRTFFISAMILYTLWGVLCAWADVWNEHQLCPSGFSGLREYPYNCYKFLHCDNGRTFIKVCGPGTAFNPLINTCDWPDNVPSCYDTGGIGLIDPR